MTRTNPNSTSKSTISSRRCILCTCTECVASDPNTRGKYIPAWKERRHRVQDSLRTTAIGQRGRGVGTSSSARFLDRGVPFNPSARPTRGAPPVRLVDTSQALPPPPPPPPDRPPTVLDIPREPLDTSNQALSPAMQVGSPGKGGSLDSRFLWHTASPLSDDVHRGNLGQNSKRKGHHPLHRLLQPSLR